MTDYRAQVILVTADAIPANYVTNSLAIEVNPDGALDTDEVTVAIKDFYDDLNGILASSIAQNGHMIKYSALPGTPPNYPFEEDTFNLAVAPSATALPSEVALVLSFQGVRAAGFPQNRRRGRIYIGPCSASINSNARPSGAAIGQLATAGATFKSNIEAVTGGAHSWSIWSPTSGEGVHVDNGWVDNAWDTQRRRGVAVTSRTTFA